MIIRILCIVQGIIGKQNTFDVLAWIIKNTLPFNFLSLSLSHSVCPRVQIIFICWKGVVKAKCSIHDQYVSRKLSTHYLSCIVKEVGMTKTIQLYIKMQSDKKYKTIFRNIKYRSNGTYNMPGATQYLCWHAIYLLWHAIYLCRLDRRDKYTHGYIIDKI